MSQILHHGETTPLTPLDKAMASTNFIDFFRALEQVLKFDTIIVETIEPISYDGRKANLKNLIVVGLALETLFSYGSLIVAKGEILLTEDLSKMVRTIDEINYLQNEEAYLKQCALLYNHLNPVGFMPSLKFCIAENSHLVETNSYLLNLNDNHFEIIRNALTYRRNILESLHSQVLIELNKRLLSLYHAPAFEWISKTQELDLSEIALSIIESPNFNTRNTTDAKLFVTKFLELFGFSYKIFTHKRSDIALRSPKNSILLKLHKTIEEIHANTPVPGTGLIQKSENNSGN